MEEPSEIGGRTETTVPGLRAWQVGEYKVLDVLGEALHWVEVGLAALSVAFVAVGVFFLLAELLHFGTMIRDTTLHTSFEDVLSDILLLVVGVELALMLVRRTPDSLIEVMFFVVARKMLIKADTFWDVLIGVAALAVFSPSASIWNYLRTGRNCVFPPRSAKRRPARRRPVTEYFASDPEKDVVDLRSEILLNRS